MTHWCFSTIAFVLLTSFKSSFAETLTNPSSGTYHCGVGSNNCTIICSADFSCRGNSIFHVYGDVVSIQCVGYYSCRADNYRDEEVKIIAHNVSQLNITATGQAALYDAEIIVDSTNTAVYTVCDSPLQWACYYSIFYYANTDTVTHICGGTYGCWWLLIYAITSIEFHCRGSGEQLCLKASVIWPIDPIEIQKTKMIYYNTTASATTFIYLPNTAYAPNIECIEGGCTNKNIEIIYGTHFDEHCLYSESDNACTTAIESYYDNMNPATFTSDIYDFDSGYTYEYTQNTILVTRPTLHKGSTFIFRSMNDAHISVLCVQCGWITLDFSSTRSVSLTEIGGDMGDIVIHGPRYYFLANFFIGYVFDATIYLENTTNVYFNGLPKADSLTPSNLTSNCNIYLDDQTNVNILNAIDEADGGSCIPTNCFDDMKTFIHSSISKSQADLESHGWNIQCTQSELDYCVRFQYESLSPTTHPTMAPTTPTNNSLMNPPKGTYHCGVGGNNCIIICSEYYSCRDSTFYVYGDVTSIECSGSVSCGFLNVIARDVSQLNITATGEVSLHDGNVVVDSTNTAVYTVCDGSPNVCARAIFYYANKDTVTHICRGEYGCYLSLIYAITSIEFHCRGLFDDFCSKPSVIWPLDPTEIQKSKMIFHNKPLSGDTLSTLIYLPNTAYAPTIECIEGCNDINIEIIYGTHFDQHCYYSDATCTTAIETYYDVTDPATFASDIYDFDSDIYSYTQNTILVIHGANTGSTINFKSVNDAHISVLCAECYFIYLDFTLATDVSLTEIAYNMENTVIFGPSNYFVANFFKGSVYNTTIYLTSTVNIYFNGLPGNCDIYLDGQTNVNILSDIDEQTDGSCINTNCEDNAKTFIHSSISQTQEVLESHGWNIQCKQSEIDLCVRFQFDSLSPTSDPTTGPTLRPTKHPSTPDPTKQKDGQIGNDVSTTTVIQMNTNTRAISNVVKDTNNRGKLAIIIGVLSGVLTVLCIFIFCRRKKAPEKDGNHVELTIAIPQTAEEEEITEPPLLPIGQKTLDEYGIPGEAPGDNDLLLREGQRHDGVQQASDSDTGDSLFGEHHTDTTTMGASGAVTDVGTTITSNAVSKDDDNENEELYNPKHRRSTKQHSGDNDENDSDNENEDLYEPKKVD